MDKLEVLGESWLRSYQDFKMAPKTKWEREELDIIVNKAEQIDGPHAAMAYIHQMLESFPKEAFLWQMAGVILNKCEHYEESLSAFKNATNEDLSHETLYNQAIAAVHAGHYSMADDILANISAYYPPASVLECAMYAYRGYWLQAEHTLSKMREILWDCYPHLKKLVLGIELALDKRYDHGFTLNPKMAEDFMPRLMYSYRPKPRVADFVIFFACDPAYLEQFGLAYIASILKAPISGKYVIHMHLYEADEDGRARCKQLQDKHPEHFVWTDETARFIDTPHRNYYLCARYWVLLQLLRTYECPILITDADMLMRQDPWPGIKARDALSLWAPCWDDAVFWDTYTAAAAVFYPTKGAKEFLEHLLSFLVEHLKAQNEEFYLDQIGLYLAHRAGVLEEGEYSSEGAHRLCSIDLGDDMLLWAATYRNKLDPNSKYWRFAKECLTETAF